ncbi:MAG: hypothetical protein QOE54_3076 [Streptosporangiaceae bacterium]|jgi:hypothetical protein|nr:hypothetical protein [Streptosporangiaceae bacterium]
MGEVNMLAVWTGRTAAKILAGLRDGFRRVWGAIADGFDSISL